MPVRVTHFSFQEIVLKRLPDIVSFKGIFLQAFADEVLGRIGDRDLLGEIDFFVDDPGEVIGVADLEGDGSIEELVGEDAYAPYIDLAVIVLALGHLWRSVERSAALGVPHEGRVDCPPEVADLDCVLNDQDVLGLDVPVDHVILVHVFNGHADLLDILPHVLFLERSLVQPFVKVLSGAGFEQEVHKLGIRSEVVEVNNVRVVKIALDYRFSHELVETLLVKLAFFYNLEAKNGLSYYVLHQVNLSIAALIQKSNHLKHLFFVINQQSFELLWLCTLEEGLRRGFLSCRKWRFRLGLENGLKLFHHGVIAIAALSLQKGRLLKRPIKPFRYVGAISGILLFNGKKFYLITIATGL